MASYREGGFMVRQIYIKNIISLMLLLGGVTQPALADLKIDSGYTYTFSSATAYTYTGPTSGSGTLAGTLILGGGKLKFSGAITISNTVSLTASSTIDVYNYSATLSGNMTGNSSASLTITDSSVNQTGRLTLSGTNTSIPNTYVNNAASLLLSGTMSGNISLGVGTLVAPTGTNSISNPIILTNTAYINVPVSTDKLIITYGISGAYNLYLTGAGKLELANGSNNTTMGLINIGNSATLISDNPTDLVEATSLVLSGTYDIDGDTQTLYNLSGSGMLKSVSANAPLIISLTVDSAYSGTIDNTITNLNLQSGNGYSYVLDTSASTSMGVSKIKNVGTTTIGQYCTLYGYVSAAQPLVINTGGTYKLPSANVTLSGGLTNSGSIDLNSRILTVSSNSTIGTISSANGSLKVSGCTGTFSEDVSRPITCLSTPTLKAGASKTLSGAITLISNTTLNPNGFTFALSGGVTGAYTLTINDTSTNADGIINLSGTNTNITSTTLTAGVLRVAANSTLPGTLIFNGGTWQAGASATTISNSVTVSARGKIDSNGQVFLLPTNLPGMSTYGMNFFDTAETPGSVKLQTTTWIRGMVNTGTLDLNGHQLSLTADSTLGTISGTSGSINVYGCVATVNQSCARPITVNSTGKLRLGSATTLGTLTLG